MISSSPPRIPTFNAGRRICKFYVDAARQVSGDDGAYDGGCCGLPTTALLISRRPPGEVYSPFIAHIGVSAVCRPGAGWCLRACCTENVVLVTAVFCGVRV